MEKHSFKGQEFFDAQCKVNDEWFYSKQRGGLTPPEGIRACAYCGSKDYYAKNMCRSCYARVLKHKPLERIYDHETVTSIQRRIRAEKKAEPFEVKVCRKAFKLPYPMEVPQENLAQTTDMLGALNDKQYYIIARHYKDGKSLEIIGGEIGVTRERIRQIECKALRKIKENAKDIRRSTLDRKDVSVFCGYTLSRRSANALIKAKIKTMKQLGDLISNGNLISIPGIGSKSANELVLVFTDWYYNRGGK